MIIINNIYPLYIYIYIFFIILSIMFKFIENISFSFNTNRYIALIIMIIGGILGWYSKIF